MERAPFEWSRPVERERERPRVQSRIPTGKLALGQPYVWATPKPRYVDDTPKMGRMGTAAFLAFLVLLAFGAVWVIERDVEGPAASQPVPQSAALDSKTSNIDDIPTPSVTQEPPPVIGSTEPPPPITPDLQARVADRPTPPLSQRPESSPPPRSAPAAVVERAPAPPTRIPFPTESPLSQRVQPTPVEPAPTPPRVAAAEAVPGPLPRIAIEEPVLMPPVTPPPEPPPAPAPAVAAAPATSPAPTTAARAPAADVDNSAIRDTLGRYRSAFNALDAKAAHQVWPTVNERTLDRAFGQLQQQNVSFDRCTIAVKGVMAEANCDGTTRFVPRVGNRSEQIEPRQWNFSLRKAYSGGWLIQEVEAR